ncbi:MAG: hypothetical protein M0Z69_03220 [Actinomycetota bacterium]|nr:hypothetical protein [Actinomycetota bacterium]
MIDDAICELTPTVGVRAACAAVGENRARYYRRHRLSPAPPRPERVVTPQPRALTEAEREEVRGVLNSPDHVDEAPATVYAKLLDEGVYLASVPTMYRILREHDEVGDRRRLHNLAELVEKAKGANRRLLELQRAGQGCAIETALWERISQPSLKEGQRTGALRFGDQRAMALAGALCVALNSVVGFTNKSLRALVSQLLDAPYSTSQMTYDLRRLRLKGLVVRVPHTNGYILSTDGIRFAVTYTKLGHRVLPPLLAPDHPPAPLELRHAFRVIDHHVHDYLEHAHLKLAA